MLWPQRNYQWKNFHEDCGARLKCVAQDVPLSGAPAAIALLQVLSLTSMSFIYGHSFKVAGYESLHDGENGEERFLQVQ
jgi:hypothetical protein